MLDNNPLSQEEFRQIYKKVPRLTVEIVITSPRGILLTLRNIDPCRGLWHVPGGTVRFGERLEDAVIRIAKRELAIIVNDMVMMSYLEYPSHFNAGLDSPVGIAFNVKSYSGDIHSSEEANEWGWFKNLPKEMHKEQLDFITSHIPEIN